MAGPKETRSAIVYVAKLPLITTKLEPLTVLTRRRVISRPWTDVMAKAMFRIRLYTKWTTPRNNYIQFPDFLTQKLSTGIKIGLIFIRISSTVILHIQ